MTVPETGGSTRLTVPSPRVRVLLVDEMRLTRDSLGALIEHCAPDFAVRGVARSEEVGAEEVRRYDLALLNVVAARRSSKDIWGEVLEISRRLTRTPLLVVAPDDLQLAPAPDGPATLRGTFPASLGVTLLVAAMRLILANGATLTFGGKT